MRVGVNATIDPATGKGPSLSLARRARRWTGFGPALSVAGLAVISFLASPAGAQPAPSAPSAVASAPSAAVREAPSVFGTVAVPFGTTPMSARWTRATGADQRETALVRLSDGKSLSGFQKASLANATVNRRIRNPSGGKCTDDGYWAPAGESFAKGFGDCVDIAIAKMTALKQLGVPARDLFLVSGRRGGGSLEAALLVRFDGRFYLLEQGVDSVSEAGQSHAFVPLVTYGHGMTWAHGIPVGRPRVIASAAASLEPRSPAGRATFGGGGSVNKR